MKKIYRAINFVAIPLLVLFAAGCGNGNRSDAYGQFEATEVTVSSQVSGKLMKFTPDEGDQLKKGAKDNAKVLAEMTW